MTEDLGVIQPVSASTVESLWGRRWGLPVFTGRRGYRPDEVEALAVVRGDEVRALATWAMVDDGATVDLVSMDAFPPGGGIGSVLLGVVVERMRNRSGVRRVELVTTNDNLGAFNFYVRHGFRLVGLQLDAIAPCREVKPSIPAVGWNGLPLLDLWVLQLEL